MRFVVAVLASSLIAPTAWGQLVVGNDQSSASATIWLMDLSGGPNRALVGPTQGVVWGLAADEPGSTLFWNNGGTLFRAAYSFGPLTPANVGALNVAGSSANVTGMAFNPSNNTLYGYRSITLPGFYSINQTTAEMVLVAATPSGTDFGGFDYDPGTNAFYGLNDGTGLQGRGLYRIDNLTSGAPTYTLLTPYPGGDTDIDGLAVGNGRAFFVNDVPTQDIQVYNLTTNLFETPLTPPFTGNGIFSGGGWAPGLIPEPTSLSLLALCAAGFLRRRR